MSAKVVFASAVLVVALAASGCEGPNASSGTTGENGSMDGSLRGELAVYIADTLDGRSETQYFLRDTAGRETRLLFDQSAADLSALTPGARLKVYGVPAGDGVRVMALETLPADAPIATGLIGATPFATRSFAFVFVDIGGGVTGATADGVNGIMTTNADSIRNYYLDDSYGMQDISTQVFGPLSFTMPDCSNTTTSQLASTLRAMVPGTFQHYLWFLGTRNASCAWSGLASVGTPQSPSRDTWYNNSTNCVVLVQEPGHNFGMQHSSSLACPGAAYADDPNTCTDSEYGDVFDPMGGGCRHMNAWQKSYQGWLGGCNGVKVSSTGTFTLLPFESTHATARSAHATKAIERSIGP